MTRPPRRANYILKTWKIATSGMTISKWSTDPSSAKSKTFEDFFLLGRDISWAHVIVYSHEPQYLSKTSYDWLLKTKPPIKFSGTITCIFYPHDWRGTIICSNRDKNVQKMNRIKGDAISDIKNDNNNMFSKGCNCILYIPSY